MLLLQIKLTEYPPCALQSANYTAKPQLQVNLTFDNYIKSKLTPLRVQIALGERRINHGC
jgi:hypothetical protein